MPFVSQNPSQFLYTGPTRDYRERDMGTVRTIDRRSEPRIPADLTVRVWGIDVRGERFLQNAKAREISLTGGLLSELEAELRSGDLIGVLFEGRQARYRVVWVRYSGTDRKIQAAVHRLAADTCPWQHLLSADAEPAPPEITTSAD